MLNDNEYTEFENRKYLSPQVALDETNTFIDNLRNTQQANNQQIRMDTYNLGTRVPSNLGGLTGAGSYFTSRYQVPQTNVAVSDLRATAQANALNQVLQNEQNKWKKRYQDAYNAYQKRAWDSSNSAGGSSAGTSGEEGDVAFEGSETIEGTVPGISGGQVVANIVPGEDGEESTISGYTYVPYGQDYKVNYVTKPTTYSSYIGTGANITKNYKNNEGRWVLEYRLPSGKTVTTGWGEELRKGSDGAYYIYNKETNNYTYAGN